MMSRNGRHLIIVAVLVILATPPVYLLLNAIYQLPVAASVEADQIAPLFNVQFLFISFFFSLIVVFMLYSIVVFRRKPGDEGDGAYFHGHTGLEIAWTIIPLVIVIALGIWAAFILGEVTAAEPEEMTVKVIGRQWSWLFEYPDYPDIGSTEQLVLPKDQPVLLEMTTQDVLHSFWVPEFRVKQDLVPGMVNSLRIHPNRVGEYKIRCAEICGLQHAYMLADIVILEPQAFQDWVDEQSVDLAALNPEERGEIWYVDYGCNACHSLDGVDGAGPTWQGIVGREEQLEDGTSVTVDEAYILNSILNPADQIVQGYQNVMPANFEERFTSDEATLLTEEGLEVDIAQDLIAFIYSIGQ
jgi:cytochrome c oxidase subunit 2